jgi:hypothetical protein
VEGGIGQTLALDFAEHRAGLDEMNVRGRANDPQCIGGEGAATGSQLGVNRLFRRSGPARAVDKAGADHLTEHLMDFGRGREVACGTQGIARGVIMRVASGHIGFDGERPVGPEPLFELLGEIQATLSGPAIGSIL